MKNLVRKPWFIAAVVLILLCIGGLIAFFVLMREDSPFAGAGTQSDPYVIADKDDLIAFNAYAGNAIDGHAGEYFALTADIDLGGMEWTPAAVSGQFCGLFDGNGHTVSNFSIAANTPNVGFFAYISGGEDAGIRNLNLTGVTISSAYDVQSLGVVAGNANAAILNCSVGANIALTGRTAYVGGVVGYTNCSIIGCKSSGSMTVSAVERLSGSNSTYEWPRYAGIAGTANGDITDCGNAMSISMTRVESTDSVKRNIHVAGICGDANGTNYSGLVNYADINAVGAVGGIFCNISSENAVIKNCYNYGDLSSTSDILCDIGGIAARSYTTGSTLPLIENCYNGGDVSIVSLLNGSVQTGYEIVVCWAGGIIGAGNFNISSCASEGNINVTGYGTHYVGGVAGGITGVLKNSYHIGDITVESKSSIIAGGVLGVLQSHEYYSGKIENLVITLERCYNVGEVNICLADNPISAAANYLTGGVVGYNMQSENVMRYNYFDSSVHAPSSAPEGYIAYTYWYGEENAGQAENVTGEAIYSNSGLTTAQMQSGAEGLEEYSGGTDENSVWVFGDGYPKLYWQK